MKIKDGMQMLEVQGRSDHMRYEMVNKHGVILAHIEPTGTFNQRQETLSLIVRAVNSHEALLEAAKELLSHFCSIGIVNVATGEDKRIYDKMEKAIAQAEGK